MGFDHGERRIGIAVGAPKTGTARALLTLAAQHGTPRWPEVDRLIDEWAPTVLVVGLPRHADGAPCAGTPGAERFARRLGGRYGRRVVQIDETLSSHEAEHRLMAAAGRPTMGRRGQRLGRLTSDAQAAVIILETWLADDARAPKT